MIYVCFGHLVNAMYGVLGSLYDANGFLQLIGKGGTRSFRFTYVESTEKKIEKSHAKKYLANFKKRALVNKCPMWLPD